MKLVRPRSRRWAHGVRDKACLQSSGEPSTLNGKGNVWKMESLKLPATQTPSGLRQKGTKMSQEDSQVPLQRLHPC